MVRSLKQLYVHLVWSTWDRAPILTLEVRQWLHPALAQRARSLGAGIVVVGGVEDHVHIAMDLPATVAVADVVKDLKGATSREAGRRQVALRWQGGYGAFTFAAADFEDVAAYVQGQEQHHSTGTVHADWERSRDVLPSTDRSA